MAESSTPARRPRRRIALVKAPADSPTPRRTNAAAARPTLRLEFSAPSRAVPLDRPAARALLRRIAADHGVSSGEISVAVVDAATIQRLHAQYLGDDTPTDVLSFELGRKGETLEGEIVACGEVAQQAARRVGWPAEAELLLYLAHGMLHLVGYDDLTPAEARLMRRRQAQYLADAGWPMPRPRARGGRRR